MLTFIIFLLVLSILVLVHELGHFLVAKKIGVKVEEFGLGYPPRLFGKKIGETIYSLNALPFGGFVRLFGEDGSTSPRPSPNRRGNTEGEVVKGEVNRAYYNRSKIERSLILLAGVFMNFVLGVVVVSYLFTQGVYMPGPGVKVENVLPNTPAQMAGLKNNDIIESVNSQKVNSTDELVKITKTKLGQTVILLVKRCEIYSSSAARSQNDSSRSTTSNNNNSCQLLTLSIVPRKTYPKNEGAMGVAIASNIEYRIYNVWQAPFYGTIEAFQMDWYILKGVGQIFVQLFTTAKVPEGVTGPIGIYKATGDAIKFEGLMGVVKLLGLLSLNLAVVNLLPIPALDGGKFFFIIVESIVGKNKVKRIEGVAQSIGVAIIFALIILISLSDVFKYTPIKSLLQNLKFPF